MLHPADLLDALAVVPFAVAGVVVAVGVARLPAAGRAAPAEFAAALGLALEFLLAAGLLRLDALPNFERIAAVGAIVVVREVIGVGLRLGLRAVGVASGGTLRA